MTREQTIDRYLAMYQGMLKSIAHKWRGLLPFDDALQAACYGLIKAVDTYDPDQGYLPSWIYLHARRAVQTEANANGPRLLNLDDEMTECIPDTLLTTHGALVRLLLNACGVTGNQADVLTTCVIENCTPDEAADALNLSERQARAYYGCAVKTLRERVNCEKPNEGG